jgi:hypothetical protein
VNTRKAYVAGLGTTGILIGSAVLALMLGTGLVAFTGAPELDDAPYTLEQVIVKEMPARHERRDADRRGGARRGGVAPVTQR